MIKEAELMAYLDGDLPAKRREEVEKAIARDERLRQVVADEWKVRHAVGECYDPVLDEDVPERLMRLFATRTGPAVEAPAKFWSGLQKWRWDFAVPLAASLVLGIFIGNIFGNGDGPGEVGSVQQVDDPVMLALDTQLSSTQTADRPVQIGISFSNHDGQLCRTYETSDATGVACRAGDEWRLRLYAPREAGRSGQFAQANSASALVMGMVQEMVAGDPLNAREEQEARDAGWKIGAD